MDMLALAQQCAPSVHPQTMAAVVGVESGSNPFAIGVVGGALVRQPNHLAEATATALALERGGYNFSVGVAQVNRYNLGKYGLDYVTAFDACASLRAGSLILKDCFDRARVRITDQQQALHAAFSCYYSGNFATGFRADLPGQPSYVQKVVSRAGGTVSPAPSIQAIPVIRSARNKPVRINTLTRTRESPETSTVTDVEGDHTVMVYR
ncbi:MAG: lytic transglycosylase domain-containing protein [Rhodoferax sp.]|nr:lytic transglycosylase domain-containing protein [Rhodoferax sp.]